MDYHNEAPCSRAHAYHVAEYRIGQIKNKINYVEKSVKIMFHPLTFPS